MRMTKEQQSEKEPVLYSDKRHWLWSRDDGLGCPCDLPAEVFNRLCLPLFDADGMLRPPEVYKAARTRDEAVLEFRNAAEGR